MNWETFREKALNCRPAEPLPPKRYYVGILDAEKSPEAPLEPDDFLWVVAHSKISIEKLLSTYAARYGTNDIKLQFEQEVMPSTNVKELNIRRDNFVVLRAVKKDRRAPLHPLDHQAPPQVPPRVPSYTSSTPSEVKEPSRIVTHSHSPKNDSTPRPFIRTAPYTPASSEHTPTPTQPLSAPTFHSSALPSGGSRKPYTPRMSISHEAAVSATPSPTSTDFGRSSMSDQSTSSPPGAIKQDSKDIKLEMDKLDIPVPRSAIKKDRKHLELEMDELGVPVPRLNPAPVKQDSEDIKPELDEPEVPVPRLDPAKVFSNDTSVDDEQEKEMPNNTHLRQLIDQQDVGLFEAGVTQAMKILDQFKSTFASFSGEDARTWIDSIDKLKLQAKHKRTVVGVVGNTGAGKSSVINAMLDEERLVPTNCMRACTAVVTEMSWNDIDTPGAKYRAEIEFISRADWEKELAVLLKEFLSEDGNVSSEIRDPNSDAGIAWAKFRAVYPKKTKETLARSEVSDLLNDPSVRNILGSTKKINEGTCPPFYRKLQQYVDSKEKATGKKDKKEKKDKNQGAEMEYWPLIKVVKIYTKSPALSTGAVIVDLPGVHDSNAARAAVAQGYMKQCTGLWIVAPINRAVDDKAAKTLLGDSFKRQLKYDGGFNNVTFICSKTDDISRTEATDSLGLEEQMSSLEDEERKHENEIRSIQGKISELRETKEVYGKAYESIDEDIEQWEKLLDALNMGKVVYAPAQKAGKRKRDASPTKDRKRRKSGDDSDDDFVVSDEESDASKSGSGSETESDSEDVQAPRQSLTEEAIEAKLQELKDSKKNARRQRLELDEQINHLRPGVKEAKDKLAAVRAEMDAICIAGRNEYSRGAIQVDFAAGIKELDQENAAEEDEENFNPDEDKRDYDLVASSLPVFCVSSRAYQKLSGRLQKDSNVPGFKTLEETEIPQLQAHCKKLTEAGRVQSCKNFFLNFNQLLNTFSLWACSDGNGANLTNDQKRSQVKYLERRLEELEKGLEMAIESCIKRVKKDIENQIYEKYPDMIEEAAQAAPNTAYKWGAHRTEGGLFWATYKATVRRDGAYTGAGGFRDFNAELMEPIQKKLATGWERTFQNRLPKAFEVYTKDSNGILRKFHDMVETRSRQNGVGLATLSMLKSQVYTNEELFNNFYTELFESMTALQRDANRDFTPVIVSTMQSAYAHCTAESGKGSYMRMKSHMLEHVDRVRHHMFKDATRTVQDHLNKMCKVLQEQMETKADVIYMSMRHDYLKALGGEHVNTIVLYKEERAMGAQIKPILMGADRRFKAVLDGTVDSLTDDDFALPKPEPDMEEETARVKAEEADEMDIDTVAEGTFHDAGINESDLQNDMQDQISPVDERNGAEHLEFPDEYQQGSASSDEHDQDVPPPFPGEDSDSASSGEGSYDDTASSEDGAYHDADDEEL